MIAQTMILYIQHIYIYIYNISAKYIFNEMYRITYRWNDLMFT